MMQTDIGEIKIKASGLSQDQAQGLGTAVGEAIRAGLPEGTQSMHIPDLNIRLSQQVAHDKERMANQIAEQILQKLKWYSH